MVNFPASEDCAQVVMKARPSGSPLPNLLKAGALFLLACGMWNCTMQMADYASAPRQAPIDKIAYTVATGTAGFGSGCAILWGFYILYRLRAVDTVVSKPMTQEETLSHLHKCLYRAK